MTSESPTFPSNSPSEENVSESIATASDVSYTPKVLYSRVASESSNRIPPLSMTTSPPTLVNGIARTSPRVAIVPPLNTSNSYSRAVSSSTPKYSPYKLDKTRSLNRLDASASSNGSQDELLEDRYSLVGYNSSPTTTPTGRDSKHGWYDMHEKHQELASIIYPHIVLCGDSIVAGLQRYPRVWNKYFKPRSTLNCGIGGDQTQHVLWRMENISLPSTVQYLVVHCGTNNIDRDSAQEIANGAVSIGLVLQENNRNLHIIITGLIPRDYDDKSYRRRKIREVNKQLKKHCKHFENFTYMSQGNDWLLEDGTLNTELYYTDYLHLIEAGNEKFASSITETIDKIVRREEIPNSSDEEETEDHSFELKHGERRRETPRKDNFVVENPFKLTRRSNERKRSLSPCQSDLDQLSSTSQKRLRTENLEHTNDGSEDRYTARRKLMRFSDRTTDNDYSRSDSSFTSPAKTEHKPETPMFVPRQHRGSGRSSTGSAGTVEYHGGFALTKELKDDPLKGIVKSIDITQTDEERLAARRAKFSAGPVGAGSSLKRLSDSAKAEVRGAPPAPHKVLLSREKVEAIVKSLGE